MSVEKFAEAIDPLHKDGKSSFPRPRPDWSLRDYAVQLLSFGAHVEHALMVQYLFAAYSLRAEDFKDVNIENKHATIEKWRSALLTVAREEMGHFLTVQNILTLLGAPTDFGRDDSPWAKPFYPFPFRLEPFSHETMVRFTFAEAPANIAPEPKLAGALKQGVAKALKRPARKAEKTFASGADASNRHEMKPRQLALCQATDADRIALHNDIVLLHLDKTSHRVGPTYAAIVQLLADDKIPDSCFDEQSYDRQAGADEWGRNYRPPPYQLNPSGERPKPDDATDLPPPSGRDAYVQVRRVATRSDAIKALLDLSEQGEATGMGADGLDEPSHYERFLEIYGELRRHSLPESSVIANPTTRKDWATSRGPADPEYTYIEAGRAHFLAQIFDQRYRLLLAYLAHTYRIARPASADRPNLRSMLMHRAFAEMYNLKTLAGLLVELPISERPGETKFAGPPFELPVTLALPMRDVEIWRKHSDLIITSNDSMRRFLAPEEFDLPEYHSRLVKGTAAAAFVSTLLQIDKATLQWIETILAGAPGRETTI